MSPLALFLRLAERYLNAKGEEEIDARRIAQKMEDSLEERRYGRLRMRAKKKDEKPS